MQPHARLSHGLLTVAAIAGLMAASCVARGADTQQIFVCGSGEDGTSAATLLELRAVPGDDGGWTRPAFYGYWPDHAPIIYPAVADSNGGRFLFANSNGPDGYVVTVRFWIGEEQFRLYSVYTAPQAGDDDIGGGVAGLEILSPDGAIRRIGCDERPQMFISSLRAAMDCDFGTALGAAACDVDRVPVRKSGDPPW